MALIHQNHNPSCSTRLSSPIYLFDTLSSKTLEAPMTVLIHQNHHASVQLDSREIKPYPRSSHDEHSVVLFHLYDRSTICTWAWTSGSWWLSLFQTYFNWKLFQYWYFVFSKTVGNCTKRVYMGGWYVDDRSICAWAGTSICYTHALLYTTCSRDIGFFMIFCVFRDCRIPY